MLRLNYMIMRQTDMFERLQCVKDLEDAGLITVVENDDFMVIGGEIAPRGELLKILKRTEVTRELDTGEENIYRGGVDGVGEFGKFSSGGFDD